MKSQGRDGLVDLCRYVSWFGQSGLKTTYLSDGNVLQRDGQNVDAQSHEDCGCSRYTVNQGDGQWSYELAEEVDTTHASIESLRESVP